MASAGRELWVDTDEETIDSLSRLAWRRVATTIEVHANGETKILTIGPAELDELVRCDNAEVARSSYRRRRRSHS
jgi:hypothetical protein